MQVINSIREMQSLASAQRSAGKKIGLVPTMGALHAGHGALAAIARQRADLTVVSIFVNPTQFGPNEDFEAYPRTMDDDLAACRQWGVDIVFLPPAAEMYPPNYSVYVDEEWISKDLCGISRPHHFRGVTTICCKLFNIVRPNVAVFGQKDAQQCAVIRKMIADLHLPVEMLVGPTVREPDGLAMSSRNRYLSAEQRKEALRIHVALREAQRMVEEGVRNVDRVIAEVLHLISEGRRLRLIYAALVDRETMKPVREIEPGRCLVAVACWVDQVRLIDNIEI